MVDLEDEESEDREEDFGLGHPSILVIGAPGGNGPIGLFSRSAGPAQTFDLAGSVTINLIRDEDPWGGWWCRPWGSSAKYSWSVDGDTLTLRPVGGIDPNHQRGGVFTGTWTRVH